MEDSKAINLLIAYDEVDHVNQLINLLRNAAYQVNSGVVDTAETLENLLTEPRGWDLAIIGNESSALPARAVTTAIREKNLDIPFILVTQQPDPAAAVEGLRMGADYIVAMDEDQLFLAAVATTLKNLNHRRATKFWKKRYGETEARCEGLMDNSQDGIAMVQEGTYVYVNERYARLFGYQSAEGMLLLPVIDTIAEQDQEKLLPYLKPLSTDTVVEATKTPVNGITPDQDAFKTTVTISQVEYRGDPALQFLVAKELLNDSSASPAPAAGTSPLANVQTKKILDSIAKAILRASRTEERSLVAYIRLDQIKDIQQNSGTEYAEQVFTVVLGKVVEKLPGYQDMARFNEDSIVILFNSDNAAEISEQAELLYQDIAANTVEVGSESFVLSISVCLSPVSERTPSAADCVNQCQQTIAEADRKGLLSGAGSRVLTMDSQPQGNIRSEKQVHDFARLLLEKRLIGIAFQPIAALHGEPNDFYEVLMRPKVDEYPPEIPKDFVARVFKTDVARDFDRWVILEAVKKLAERHNTRPSTKLFINLSAATLQDGNFTAWLKVALQATKASPSDIIFQLREIDVGRYIDQSARLIEQLGQLNSRATLTHFGLAINPLLVLEKLPFDFVKLDKVVVDAATNGAEELGAMIQLIDSLREAKRQVIIPFIETPAMMPSLWQHGVSYIQGHYIQPPMETMDYDFSEG